MEEALANSPDMEKEEVSGGERSAKCQSVTFTSGISKEDLDKPKLQRIPTPYYENLHTTTSSVDEAAKNTAAVESQPPQVEPLQAGGDEDGDVVEERLQTEVEERQTVLPPKSSVTRRIHREFSMSRDD